MSESYEKHTTIDLLIQHIEGDKEQFLSDLKTTIKNHVGAKGRVDCLKITTTRNGVTVIWSLADHVPYALRLIAYLRKVPYREDGRIYEVDSVLTREILHLVLEKLSAVILRHQDIIADVAMTEILLKDSTRDRFLDVLLKGHSANVLNAKGKSMIAGALLHGMQQKIHHLSASVAANLGDKVTQLLAAASKTAIVTGTAGIVTKFMATAGGKIIVAKFSLVIAESLAPLVAKLIAMPVIQASMKKIVITAVIAATAKVIAGKIGMSVTAAVWFVLVPLILALLGNLCVSF